MRCIKVYSETLYRNNEVSIFQCEKCGCGENTALGRYHTRNMDIWAEENRGLALCSACSPTQYASGEKVGGMKKDRVGSWHGKWSQTFYPKGEMSTNKVGNLIHTASGKASHECGLGRDTEYK